MSEDEIKKAVKEAEQYAAEDKAKKEEAETFNQADNTIYQAEKTVRELGDKLSPEDKATIESELETFKNVRTSNSGNSSVS